MTLPGWGRKVLLLAIIPVPQHLGDSLSNEQVNISKDGQSILSLEQTVNRDASSRHTGISAFTDSIKARKQGTITRSTRGTIVGKLLEMAGLSNLEEASQESNVDKVITALRSTMNHFNAEGTDNTKLYHLSSGRAASNDMKDDLISVVSKNTTWADKFRQECKENPVRCEKPIKRIRLKI